MGFLETPISKTSSTEQIDGVIESGAREESEEDSSDEDREEAILFYCKAVKSMGHMNAKFHVRSPLDPAVTACPSGGKIKDLILIPEETIPSEEVCMTCRRRNPPLEAWFRQRYWEPEPDRGDGAI